MARQAIAERPISPFLPADAVMAIGELAVRARCVADGVLAGLHRSRRHGESAEFAEHKDYAPGDDVRRMDWRASGKSDRYYVKRFEEETSLRATMVVDRSASMSYPPDDSVDKYAYAATLAAALAYLLLHQSDTVGLITFATEADRRMPVSARATQLAEIAAILEREPVTGGTDAVGSFSALADLVHRRSLVVVFSDLLGVADSEGGIAAWLQQLAVLRARGADVALVQVLHPDELDLPFPGVVRFDDLELDRQVQVDVPAIRAAYREEIGAYLGRLKREALGAGISYHLVRTDESPASALMRFVAGRIGSSRR